MRILFNAWRDLVHSAAGGSETMVDHIARGLTDRGHDVVARLGGPVTDHPYPVFDGGGTHSQYLRTPLDLRRHGRFDLVVDVINGMAYYSPVLTRTPTLAFVHHVHTEQWAMYYPPPIAAFGRLQETLLMPRAYRGSLFVAVSPSTVEQLAEIGVNPSRIRLLPMDCRLAPIPSTARSTEPLFLAVGRLTSHKRIDLLLAMWDRVKPVTGGELVIVGDGPERERLEALAGPGVRFVGRVSEEEKATWYHRAWLLVHSAAWEGWGMVITEAGMASTPALGFDVGGVRDAVAGGRAGELAADEEDFVRAWIDLACDTRRREALGAAARRFATTIHERDLVEAFEEVALEAAAGGAQRHIQRLGFSGSLAVALLEQQDGTVVPRPTSASLSVIVPAFDETRRLPSLISALRDHVDVADTEVIVVDDGSTDGTADLARLLLADFPRGRVIELGVNRGKGAAVRAGVAAARGDRIVFLDADNATDLTGLDPLLAALGDHHIAIGSRTHADAEVLGGEEHRRAMALSFNKMVQALTEVRIRDTQCGFKAFRGPVARLLFGMSVIDGFAQDVEILDHAARMGLRVAEVPVRWTAVPGSKIHLLRDPLRTAAELVGMRLGYRRRRAMPVEVLTVCGPDALALARRSVRRTDPILVHSDERVSVLLPGPSAARTRAVQVRLAGVVGDDRIRRGLVTAADIAQLGRLAEPEPDTRVFG